MKKVLVVEDELLIRELASEDLTDAGFEVTTASDGDEALAVLGGGNRFDLLLTDIRMPGTVDGWELARRAKRLIPELRVIYATGLDEGIPNLPENEGLIRKPFSKDDLLNVLAKLGAAGTEA